MNQYEPQLVLVAGLSGAGRSTATGMAADLGYYVLENLPIDLIPTFLKFVADQKKDRYARIALSVDIDSTEKQVLFLEQLALLGFPKNKLSLLYLDCAPEEVVRRYSTTRRPHPGFDAAKDKSLLYAIVREKQRLEGLREKATVVIDTSALTPHDLRVQVGKFLSSLPDSEVSPVRVNVVSFGFKYGLPNDCDLVMDVRFLPNPFFVPHLKELTGMHESVSQYVLKSPGAKELLDHYMSLLKFLIPRYEQSGKRYVNIGIGCTGGQHRSVALTEHLASLLTAEFKTPGYLVSTLHRDIAKSKAAIGKAA